MMVSCRAVVAEAFECCESDETLTNVLDMLLWVEAGAAAGHAIMA